MPDLTLVTSVYGQPKMLERWVAEIELYPDDVLDALAFVVVDDHGEPPVAVPTLALTTKFTLLRSERDVPWNQPGARNAGMLHAEGWCVMMDPDMVIDRHEIGRFLEKARTSKRGQVTRFLLKHKRSKKLDRTSPNTYLIHTADFWGVGGYDEDYCGHKGYSDVQLLSILEATYKTKHDPLLWAWFFSTDDVSDAAVRTLDRSVAHNRKVWERKRAESRACGGWKKWLKQKGNTGRVPVQRVHPS